MSLLAGLLFLVIAPASPEPGHRGIHAQLFFGPGYADAAGNIGALDADAHGPTVGLHGSLGLALIEGLVLSLEASHTATLSTTVSFSSFSRKQDWTEIIQTLGLQLTYFTLDDKRLGLGVVAARALLSDGHGSDARSSLGPALEGTVGKDWWVDERVTLGIAARLMLGYLPSAIGPGTSTVAAVMVGMNITWCSER